MNNKIVAEVYSTGHTFCDDAHIGNIEEVNGNMYAYRPLTFKNSVLGFKYSSLDEIIDSCISDRSPGESGETRVYLK